MAQNLNRTLSISDNQPVLRGTNSESIDLIANDPPFNKGPRSLDDTDDMDSLTLLAIPVQTAQEQQANAYGVAGGSSGRRAHRCRLTGRSHHRVGFLG